MTEDQISEFATFAINDNKLMNLMAEAVHGCRLKIEETGKLGAAENESEVSFMMVCAAMMAIGATSA